MSIDLAAWGILFAIFALFFGVGYCYPVRLSNATQPSSATRLANGFMSLLFFYIWLPLKLLSLMFTTGSAVSQQAHRDWHAEYKRRVHGKRKKHAIVLD